MKKILIIDDERTARKGLQFILKSADYKIFEAENAGQAENILKNEEFDLVIADLRLPTEETGLNLIKSIRTKYNLTPILVMTAFGSLDSAVKAMKAGAEDYVTKDFTREEILLKIEKLLETRMLWLANLRLTTEVKNLKEKFDLWHDSYRIIGESEEIKQILKIIDRVGKDNDSTVLITGESGTGKELVARSIHKNSPERSKNKFVVVDIANMPPTLLESQLFGHEKGAFTNAHQQHIGFIELANGGTIFLDEIGDFPLELQTKLLRFLQEKVFIRVGGSRSYISDVRIVAATNKNLDYMVEQGLFRQDLFYRLNVIRIYLPPLRERRDDIPVMLNYFCEMMKEQKNRELTFPKEIVERLKLYDWPGNIRQLKNLIESLFVVCPHNEVREIDLIFENRADSNKNNNFAALLNMPFKQAKKQLMDEFEREFLKYYLARYQGNISKIASEVGESREGLSKKIKRFGLKN